MVESTSLVDIRRMGPAGSPPELMSVERAEAYCRALARRHYENFLVTSCLLPWRLRQPFCNVYAYCRWADDLADEQQQGERALELLDWWREELRACYRGRPNHPVFVALARTIDEHRIPIDPFLDLLIAFERDQRQHRYDTAEEVLDYCRYSAHPVGRIVLYLGRCHRDECLAPADALCTGLQLANFCQDVARDWDQGRIYLPADSLAEWGYTEADFAARRYNAAFRDLMAVEVERAERYLDSAWPLVERVAAEIRFQVALFLRGGLAILEKIRQVDYDVWSCRPKLTKRDQWRLLWRTWRHASKPVGQGPQVTNQSPGVRGKG